MKTRLKYFDRNEIIHVEEDTNEFMYAVLSGETKVVKTTS
jgi:CRP-like cAMP-binding protein